MADENTSPSHPETSASVYSDLPPEKKYSPTDRRKRRRNLIILIATVVLVVAWLVVDPFAFAALVVDVDDELVVERAAAGRTEVPVDPVEVFDAPLPQAPASTSSPANNATAIGSGVLRRAIMPLSTSARRRSVRRGRGVSARPLEPHAPIAFRVP